MEYLSTASEKRRLVLSIIAICFAGIATGLFLGGAILPFRAPSEYLETTADAGRMLNVVHAHDTQAQHEHVVTTVVTVKETSPHGYAHNFLTALTAGLFAGQAQIQGQSPNEITIWAREFHPPSITVAAGTKITWTNKDPEEHTATSNNGLFDGYLPGYGSYSYTFNQPGIYEYYCDPHPIMTGVVIVK